MVPTPLIRRVLLLGARYTACLAKSCQLCILRGRAMEILPQSYKKFVLYFSAITSTLMFLPAEEQYLIRFFGDDYRTYKRSVGTKIPFIP